MTEPLYRQLKNHIREHIQSGEWKPGDRVPSESELVKSFGVSRMTANRALRELQSVGVLKRIAGVGTFVSSTRAQGEFMAVRDIAEELAEGGFQHSVDVIDHKILKADTVMADRFEVELGAGLIFNCIRHLKDTVPILLERRWVDRTLVPEYEHIDLVKESSYQFLMRTAPLQKVEHTVRAMLADQEVQDALELPSGTACLMLRRRTWSADHVASYVELIYVGDRYEMTSTFSPT